MWLLNTKNILYPGGHTLGVKSITYLLVGRYNFIWDLHDPVAVLMAFQDYFVFSSDILILLSNEAGVGIDQWVLPLFVQLTYVDAEDLLTSIRSLHHSLSKENAVIISERYYRRTTYTRLGSLITIVFDCVHRSRCGADGSGLCWVNELFLEHLTEVLSGLLIIGPHPMTAPILPFWLCCALWRNNPSIPEHFIKVRSSLIDFSVSKKHWRYNFTLSIDRCLLTTYRLRYFGLMDGYNFCFFMQKKV